MEIIASLEGNGSRPSHQGSGIGSADKMFTLNTTEVHAICYRIDPYESNSMKSSNPYSGIHEVDVSATLDMNCSRPDCRQGGIAIVCINQGG